MNGGRHAVDQVGGYVRGTALIAAATALMAGVAMWALGVPFAGPLAVVVLIGAFVPYIGRALSLLLIVVIALGDPRSGARDSALRPLRRRLDRPRSCPREADVGTEPPTAPDPRRGRIATRLRRRWVRRPHRHLAGARLRADGGRRRHHRARPRTQQRTRAVGNVHRPQVRSPSGSIVWASGAGDRSSSPRCSSSSRRWRCCSRG